MVKGILFNSEMVRAILDGRKTVTRRIVKIPYELEIVKIVGESGNINNPLGAMYLGGIKRPPYQPGDILYVRETWCWEPCWDCGMDTEEHNCCDESANKFFNHDKGEWGCYGYKASLGEDAYPSVDTWHPSIHMPKEAARIWLKVTDVRVERLQEITVNDCVNEGAYWIPKNPEFIIRDSVKHAAIKEFSKLWESTIKKSDLDRYGWDANPWVWVIEFEQCEKPKPCILKGVEPAEEKRPCIGYALSDTDDEPCEMCKGCKQCTGNDEFERCEKTEGKS